MTAAASCATMDQAPCSTVATNARPCRQKEMCTSHRRCAWLHAQWVLNTGSSLHTAFFLILAPFFQQVFPNASARCTGTIGPQMGCWRGAFSQTALRRAAGRCDGLWRSTMQETSMRRRMERYRETFCLGSPPDHAAAMAGQFTLDPLTLYIDCEGTIATINGPKHKALGAQGPRAHVWNRLLFSHDEVRAIKVKGHATERDVEAGRTSHLCKRRNDLADTFAKKGADTHKPAFRVAKTVVACASLAKQAARWAAKRTFCSGSGGGTTPGLLRHDHGYGHRERDSSESGRRRLLRRLQVRFLTGFLPFSPHVSRRTVTWTLAHSEGTACNWDEFPMLEAELWTTPSSFAPSVERSTGSVWFDQRRSKLWEAYGLNDQLESKLTLKAGGVRSHKTD